MTTAGVSYQTILTSNADEATSLAGYLTEHGLFATCNGAEVSALSDDVETFQAIQTLKGTWKMFWDNSDSGLLGLPMFIKTEEH